MDKQKNTYSTTNPDNDNAKSLPPAQQKGESGPSAAIRADQATRAAGHTVKR